MQYSLALRRACLPFTQRRIMIFIRHRIVVGGRCGNGTILGQMFLKWMIGPVQDLRKLISEILFYLANDHSTIHGAMTVHKEEALSVSKNLERLGASLLSGQNLIPFYDRARKCFRLPDYDAIVLASKHLSLISKSMFGEGKIYTVNIDLYRLDICEALGLDDPIQNGMSKQELKCEIRKIRNQSCV